MFMTVIKQLEGISNAYLMVLADGGIQLVLEGDTKFEEMCAESDIEYIYFTFFL